MRIEEVRWWQRIDPVIVLLVVLVVVGLWFFVTIEVWPHS